jgi:hypothetical protein
VDLSPPSDSGSCVPWTPADDLLASFAAQLRTALDASRADLPPSVVIDDSGPSWNASFAAPDPDAERSWKFFRSALRDALGTVRGLSFVEPSQPGATHLLTAKLDETADRSVTISLELVDMSASKIVWRSSKSGKIGP